MGVSWSDVGRDAHDADRADAALNEAVSGAKGTAARLTKAWAGNPLLPEVSVELTVGGDDEPLFVFSISVDLADDLDAAEYPLDEIGRLKSELRAQVRQSPVDQWSSLVTVRTKVGAANE